MVKPTQGLGRQMSQDEIDWDFILAHFPLQAESLSTLEERMGYQFKNIHLMYEACTHASAHVAYPWNRVQERERRHFEKLECLGDAVTDLIVTDLLWRTNLIGSEGALSRIRASLVNEASLAKIAVEIALEQCLMMSFGEDKSGGRQRASLQADALEALIGAVYLDGGFDPAYRLVRKIYAERILDAAQAGEQKQLDPKTKLQEWAQAELKVTPAYELLEATGPDHKRSFKVAVKLKDKVVAVGCGSTKKSASEKAARKALHITFDPKGCVIHTEKEA
ncbi:MAG: ribonuclease III [Zetaproteobacteria bacterium]|nr:ribonuclease III [Zetaproteobacteria bacterium]